jgi:hypothetical protein
VCVLVIDPGVMDEGRLLCPLLLLTGVSLWTAGGSDQRKVLRNGREDFCISTIFESEPAEKKSKAPKTPAFPEINSSCGLSRGDKRTQSAVDYGAR